MFQNWKSIAAVGGALLTLLPLSAQAGADGRKNTAIALGAAAAYELLKGKTTEAIVLGAGTAYAAKRYEDARKDESDRNNGRYYYGNDYNKNTDPYYDSGYGNRNTLPSYGNNSRNHDYNNTYNNAPTYNNANDRDYENYGSSSQYPYRSNDRTQQFGRRHDSSKRGWNRQQNNAGR